MGNFDQLLLALACLCWNGFLGRRDVISSLKSEGAPISGVLAATYLGNTLG